VALFEAGSLQLGHASVQVPPGNFSAATRDLYARIFTAARGRQLYRMWNYVPAINATAPDGLENYRAFCRGRSLAFEAEFGADFQPKLPSASAVGCEGDVLSTVFVAGDAEPRHIENPEQVPAYHYPAEHGPRSPSFARATVVATAAGKLTFISGTAAIKGHATVAPDSLDEQLTCTLDNLRIISRAAGAGERLGAGTRVDRTFKVYVRHAESFPLVKRRLETELLQAGDRVIYLRADICRAALEVEIEATLVKR
jgi:enamine deaminase RidA (YjgF/YER057c/UK114 family)